MTKEEDSGSKTGRVTTRSKSQLTKAGTKGKSPTKKSKKEAIAMDEESDDNSKATRQIDDTESLKKNSPSPKKPKASPKKNRLLLFDDDDDDDDVPDRRKDNNKSFTEDLLDSVMHSEIGPLVDEAHKPIDDVPYFVSSKSSGSESMSVETKSNVNECNSGAVFEIDFDRPVEGTLLSFRVFMSNEDSFEEDPIALISGPAHLEVYFSKENKHKFVGQFFPTRHGEYTIIVLYKNKVVEGTPFSFSILSATHKKRKSSVHVTRPLKRSKNSELLLFNDDDEDDEDLSFVVETGKNNEYRNNQRPDIVAQDRLAEKEVDPIDELDRKSVV